MLQVNMQIEYDVMPLYLHYERFVSRDCSPEEFSRVPCLMD